MKRNLLVALGLALALAGALIVSYRAQAQEVGPTIVQGAQAPQAAVGTGFSYQGRLLQNGSPYSGTCDFEFNLYDDVPSTPNKVAGPVNQTNISVNDGYFSTFVDFGSSAFTGEGRQLQIGVRCPAGSGSYTTLSGYVTLPAAPYAIGLRPGATISSSGVALNLSTSSSSGSALRAVASSVTGNPAAVYGESGAAEGAGLSGYNSSSGYGLYASSMNGTGIYGRGYGTGTIGIATNTGKGYGVYGWNNSHSGAGVYGESGYSSGTGVRGYSDGGVGVEGSSDDGNGVVGSSGSGNGVWGYSANGYAIYSQGDTYINGHLRWVTRTGYIAVSAAAFRPKDNSYSFENQGSKLMPGDYDQYYYAPVYLPNNASVVKLTYYWYDAASPLLDTRCRLYRNDLAGSEANMAEASSAGSIGNGSSSTGSITYPEIDNQNYSYYLEWYFDDTGEYGYGVVIEYEYTEPY